MKKKTFYILITTLLLLLAAPALAGNWVVITLQELPPEIRAGEPVSLEFVVRQHGVSPIDGVNLVVRAEHGAGGDALEWVGEPGGQTGHYLVEAVFPEAGDWTWQVTAAPFPQVTTLPALRVQPALVEAETAPAGRTTTIYIQALQVGSVALLGIAAALALARRRRLGLALAVAGALLLLSAFAFEPAPAESVTPADQPEPVETRSPAEVGADLFLAKGCVGCHRHNALPQGDGLSIGPNLSRYEPDPDFVRAWLRDPAAVRPGTEMPNLELDDAEIEALLAFLSQEEQQKTAAASAGREACPVTQPPSPPHQPPAGTTDLLREDPRSFWYGGPALSTSLLESGVWHSLPHDEHGYTQKQPFWSEGYNWREEQDPDLLLTGRRLDGDETMTDDGASNAYHPDYGSMIMTGFVLPTAGCWEITASYNDATLTYVVWVQP